MGVIKRVCGWLVTVLLLTTFIAGNAFGSQMEYEPRVIIVPSIEHVNIGEKTFIPIEISYSPDWKSAKISLEITEWSLQEGADPNFVRIDKIKLDSTTQAPYTAYIPITVTGEGLFDFKGNITIEAPDGEKFRNGKSSWTVSIVNTLGIFAFDGKVFFGGSSGLAMEVAAVHSLQKTNSEYNKLLNKKESIDEGTLKQNLSEEENQKLKQLRNDAVENIYKLYFERYPIKTEPTSL